jgi:hypothetical protein
MGIILAGWCEKENVSNLMPYTPSCSISLSAKPKLITETHTFCYSSLRIALALSSDTHTGSDLNARGCMSPIAGTNNMSYLPGRNEKCRWLFFLARGRLRDLVILSSYLLIK